MCARVAIDLKLFNIIADTKRPIASAELAAETGAEEQLLGTHVKSQLLYLAADFEVVRILRGLTISGLVREVSEQLYEANDATRHAKIPSVQAGIIHL
jgi:hypothetical protein